MNLMLVKNTKYGLLNAVNL